MSNVEPLHESHYCILYKFDSGGQQSRSVHLLSVSAMGPKVNDARKRKRQSPRGSHDITEVGVVVSCGACCAWICLCYCCLSSMESIEL